MAERASGRMTEADFLAFTEGREERWELADGMPRMMAGAGRVHDRIVVNVLRLLSTQLRGGRREPFTGDTFVRIPGGNYRMPDAGVECGMPDDRDRAAQEPRLVVEVLSPSTRPIDFMRKLDEYRAVPGLDHVLIIEPEVVQVLVWAREGGVWDSAEFESVGDRVEMPALGLVLPLADVYEDVEVTAE